MHSSALRLVVGVTLVLSVAYAVGATNPEAVSPWDLPPLTASPAQLRAVADEVPVDDEHGIQVLFEEGRFLVDAAGRVEYAWRFVYRIDAPSLVASWSVVQSTWRPWHQERPEIRARVVTAEGTEHVLDPTTLGEYSEGEDGPDLFGDEMSLRGPLPAADVGAVVEEYHVVRDHRPRFDAGSVQRFSFAADHPIQQIRLVIDSDPAVPLRFATFALPGLEPSRSEVDGRQRLVFEEGPVEPWEEDTASAPGDVPRRPMVAFSTGASWNVIAGAYAAIVDERIAAGGVAELTRELVGGETDRAAVLEVLLRSLRDTVRYTGIEFGERSFVPDTPAATVQRRFGDCKDKATLLVAMLREAGIEAHVALLQTGPGMDADPKLPGIGWFDHAIVRVGGEDGMWIDPTDEFARPGELPNPDRGRLALIAAAGTTGLVPTPENRSTEHVRRERREVRLAVDGDGEIVETSEVTGWIERGYRATFDSMSDTEIRDQLESYVIDQYRADGLGDYEIDALDDLSKPLRLRVVATGCGTAQTSSVDAAAAISVGALVRDLPDRFSETDDEEDEDAGPTTPRRHPFVLLEPFVVEIDYEIHPAPGYAITTLPESRERQLGPAVLSERYEADDDGVVTASLRFDTVKTVYSAAEVEAIGEALHALFAEKNPVVVYHNVGERFLAGGQIREALQEFQRLVEEHPDEAIYRTQVARAFLTAGLGAQARQEARRAVELAPDSVISWTTLGLILAHDELGRKFHAGFDPRGAEEAFRKAVELDPESFVARGELAILLDYDDRGVRYAPTSRVEEAIAEYAAIRDQLDNESLTPNLMASQLYAGRFGDLRSLWKDAPRTAVCDAIYLAATAATDSVEAANREAARITTSGENYRQQLVTAANNLLAIRRYAEASAMLTAGAKGSPDSVKALTQADLLARIVRHEQLKVDRSTPEGAVRTFFVDLILQPEPGADRLPRALHPELAAAAEREVLEETIDMNRDVVRQSLRSVGSSDEQALDSLLSLATMSSTPPGPAGSRVRVRPVGLSSAGTMPIDFYTTPCEGGHCIVGFTFAHSMIGEMLLRWADEGRLEDARTWLDWMVEESLQFNGGEELEGAPVQWLWTSSRGADDLTADGVRLAAASLMLDGAYGERPLEILRGLRDGVEDESVRTGIDLALALGAQDLELPELQLEAADRLASSHPRSTVAFGLQVHALVTLERFDEAAERIDDRLERMPGDETAVTLHTDLPHLTGDLVEYRRRMETVIDSGRGTAGQYNNLAWLDIVEDRVSDATRQLAQQSVTLTDYSQPAFLHTLAAVYAELGMTTEARNVVLALLENRSSDDLESPDWYIIGRIAEQYGAPDAALDAYERVEPPEDGEPAATSTFHLAERRLQALRTTTEDTVKTEPTSPEQVAVLPAPRM